MRAYISRLIERKHTSLLVILILISAQCLMLPILWMAGLYEGVLGSSFASLLYIVWCVVWYPLPTLSVFGIYAGRFYIRKNGWHISPVIGVAFNIIWLLLCVAVVLAILSGLTV